MNEEQYIQFVWDKFKVIRVTKELIAQLHSNFINLTINGQDDADGYEYLKKALAIIVNKRTVVDRQKKRIPAETKEQLILRDQQVKIIKSLLLPIENHLRSQLSKYQDEKKAIIDKKNSSLIQRISMFLACGFVDADGFLTKGTHRIPIFALEQMSEKEFQIELTDQQSKCIVAGLETT